MDEINHCALCGQRYYTPHGPTCSHTEDEWDEYHQMKFLHEDEFLYAEENCPGHVAAAHNAKICKRCGIHVDSLR